MSEPEIANLARRLAEQNNVDWRALTGSGPDGKILESDVLDFLARVMAGEEALDPTPEPLPDGMEAWPDQDAPTYHQPNGAPHAERDVTAAAGGGLMDDLLADVPEDDVPDADVPEDEAAEVAAAEADFGQTDGVLDAVDAVTDTVSDAVFSAADRWEDAAEDLAHDVAAEAPTQPFAAPFPADGVDDDDEISDDIFLFDDDDPAATGETAAAGYQPSVTADGAVFADDLAEVPAGQEDPDDVLLVADDDYTDDYETPDTAAHDEPETDQVDTGGVFASSLESYDQEFTTPSEQFGSDDDTNSWTTGGLTDVVAEADQLGESTDVGAGDLPDLWAGDAGATDEYSDPAPASETFAPEADVSYDELKLGEPVPDQPELDPVDYAEGQQVAAPESEDAQPTYAADTFGYADVTDAPDLTEAVEELAGDDVADLEQAEALDELDAVTDLQQLDAQPDVATAAGFSQLPFVRTGNVMRRHVDLSGLAGAQLAAGLELGHDEPLAVAPFLVRAVAKAAQEQGGLDGEVALAQLGGEVTFRRVDDASGRSFASLVEELAGPGSEEDELGLVVVDLSGVDMDEILLDLDVPAVTLGRILYDTQGGSHRSTLALSGDLPLEQGARLLARVAELLDAPIRLLV